MKIMTQERNQIIDTVNADIFLDNDGVWYYVKIRKANKIFVLGAYSTPERANAECVRIFEYIKVKRTTLQMARS